MAKATNIKIKLVSSADTGFYYVTRKNSRTMTDKLVKKKYDPVAKKHVEFREAKIKWRGAPVPLAILCPSGHSAISRSTTGRRAKDPPFIRAAPRRECQQPAARA